MEPGNRAWPQTFFRSLGLYPVNNGPWTSSLGDGDSSVKTNTLYKWCSILYVWDVRDTSAIGSLVVPNTSQEPRSEYVERYSLVSPKRAGLVWWLEESLPDPMWFATHFYSWHCKAMCMDCVEITYGLPMDSLWIAYGFLRCTLSGVLCDTNDKNMLVSACPNALLILCFLCCDTNDVIFWVLTPKASYTNQG